MGQRKPWQATALTAGVLLLIGSVTVAVVLDARARQITRANRELEIANGELTIAKDETDRILELALGAMEKYYFDTSNQIRELPRGEPLFLQILDRAHATLKKIDTIKPNDPRIQHYQADSQFKLAELESSHGRQDRAAQLTPSRFEFATNCWQGLREIDKPRPIEGWP